MAVATPTELKPQFIMPLSSERGRFRLQAQQKEARPPYHRSPEDPNFGLRAQALLPVQTGVGSGMQ